MPVIVTLFLKLDTIYKVENLNEASGTYFKNA